MDRSVGGLRRDLCAVRLDEIGYALRYIAVRRVAMLIKAWLQSYMGSGTFGFQLVASGGMTIARCSFFALDAGRTNYIRTSLPASTSGANSWM